MFSVLNEVFMLNDLLADRLNSLEKEMGDSVDWLKGYLTNPKIPDDEKIRSIISCGEDLKTKLVIVLELRINLNRVSKNAGSQVGGE